MRREHEFLRIAEWARITAGNLCHRNNFKFPRYRARCGGDSLSAHVPAAHHRSAEGSCRRGDGIYYIERWLLPLDLRGAAARPDSVCGGGVLRLRRAISRNQSSWFKRVPNPHVPKHNSNASPGSVGHAMRGPSGFAALWPKMRVARADPDVSQHLG